MVSDKENIRIVKNNIKKHFGIAVIAGICIEMVILLFTDNKMQSSTNEEIVRQNVPNTFRVLLFINLIWVALYQRKKIVHWMKARWHANYKLIRGSVGIFLAVTAVWTAFFLMLLSIRIRLNSIYYLVGVFSGMALACFFLYRIHRIKQLESLFLVQSILFVTLCVFVYPPFVYGGDSGIHLKRAVEISQSYGTNIFPEYHDIVDSPDAGGWRFLKSEIEYCLKIRKEYMGIRL